MHQGPPGRPVALEAYLSGSEGDGGEVVHHDVQTQPRREAVRGGVAQVGRAERVISQPGELPFGQHLGLAVGSDGEQFGVLCHATRPGRAVQTARRSEKEALDTGPLGGSSQLQSAIEIDREGGLRVEMAERVIGEGGQAGHGVVAGQVARFGLPHVNRKAPADVFRSRAEVTSLIQAEVKAVYVVPRPAQEGNENGSDVATITRNKDPHRMPLVHLRSLDREVWTDGMKAAC